MLNFLERFIQSQLNVRAFCILVIALIVCIAEFSLRSSFLKPVPDGHVLNPFKKQLEEFIRDPRKPELTAAFAIGAGPWQFKTEPPTPREARRYYAATEATTDVAFPIVYGTLIGLIFWWLFGQAGRALLLIPLAIVIADFTENATFIWLALKFDCTTNEVLIPAMAVWPNWIKWSLALVAALVAVHGLRRKFVAAPPTQSP